MTNQEQLDKQIAELAEHFRGTFTEEEILHMETVFEELIKKTHHSSSVERND
jgi:hypothetical protein